MVVMLYHNNCFTITDTPACYAAISFVRRAHHVQVRLHVEDGRSSVGAGNSARYKKF